MYIIKYIIKNTSKSAKLEQLILFLMHFKCSAVYLKVYSNIVYKSIFDCAKVELLSKLLNILHLKTDMIQKSYNPHQ